MRVFLADLGHDQLTISSDVYPLGVASLATYLAEHHDTDESFDIRISVRRPSSRPPSTTKLRTFSA